MHTRVYADMSIGRPKGATAQLNGQWHVPIPIGVHTSVETIRVGGIINYTRQPSWASHGGASNGCSFACNGCHLGKTGLTGMVWAPSFFRSTPAPRLWVGARKSHLT